MGVSNKRRNSEKRKEKSRDAARCRRGKEAEIFSDLASHLPLPMSTIDALDKASIMRLLLSDLKIRTVMNKRPKYEVPDDELELKLDSLYPKALDGFLLILSKDGDLIYVSEGIAHILGLQQIELIGQSIYDYAHACDHEEIQEVLSPRSGEEGMPRTVFIRLKCTLTPKGRSVNLKSATFKVIKLTGKYVADDTVADEIVADGGNDIRIKEEDSDDSCSYSEEGVEGRGEAWVYRPQGVPHFLATAEAIPHPSNIEVPLDRRTFTSRHSMNMRFTDCDERVKRLIGYQAEELIGQTFYGFHHAIDSKMMDKAFRDLFSKGQIRTGQYRFLAKNGGYVWMLTEATVIYNPKSQKPEHVVCVHYVLSHVEQHGRILASSQISVPTAKSEFSRITRKSLTKTNVLKTEEGSSQKPTCQKQPVRQARTRSNVKVEDLFHVPQFSTEAVFAERTAEMDQDFFFPKGIKRTVGVTGQLDLSHLAPHNGEVCIPLDPASVSIIKQVHSFGSQLDLFDEMASDTQLLPFSEHSLSPRNRNQPTLLSPIAAEKSPSAPSPLGNLGYLTTLKAEDISASSPPGYLTTINAGDISAMDNLFTNLDTVDEDHGLIDFELRAPYIPMSLDEDVMLCQPSKDTLLNMGEDFNPAIFGCTESVFSSQDDTYEGAPHKKRTMSPREMMGGSTVQKSLERPYDIMMMKMKRPLDRNCLETGPPAKMTKYQAPLQLRATKPSGISQPRDHSVLMNLLLRGEDMDHGYVVNKKQNISPPKAGKIMRLTSHNIEVNAPSHSGNLLFGQDIVSALNMSRC
ncbi:hypoxia-inducible factor 1-alpha-like isoform X2 [Dreissena polymorpha]|nr:hypoxia-inducible factor 1-alpha-like isoform X2 [Dreissena polymorpha]